MRILKAQSSLDRAQLPRAVIEAGGRSIIRWRVGNGAGLAGARAARGSNPFFFLSPVSEKGACVMIDASRYQRIVIDKFRYRGFNAGNAWCALEILQGKDGRTVVVATELKGNPGTSVPNVCEYLASVVCAQFSIDPLKLVWIQHVDYRSPLKELRPRSYDLVTFRVSTRGNHIVFAQPKCRHMSDDDWIGLGLEPRVPAP